LIVGFATSLVTCQHIDSFPQDFVFPVALQTDHVPLRHVLPELERLITAFHSSSSSPLFTRRPRIAYGSSTIHDANDPASACGIDALHHLPFFPLATSTRTSLVSFEPLLTLLTRRRLSPFFLLFRDSTVTPRQPWPVPGSFRTAVFGSRFLGSVELMGWCSVG
jgi:hypothetical protein